MKRLIALTILTAGLAFTPTSRAHAQFALQIGSPYGVGLGGGGLAIGNPGYYGYSSYYGPGVGSFNSGVYGLNNYGYARPYGYGYPRPVQYGFNRGYGYGGYGVRRGNFGPGFNRFRRW